MRVVPLEGNAAVGIHVVLFTVVMPTDVAREVWTAKGK
jgi:hypothetical protein